MFEFMYSCLISPFLCILMMSAICSGGCSQNDCVLACGASNLDRIKESSLTINCLPRTHLQTSTIIHIGGSQRKLLTSNMLEMSTSSVRRLACSEVMDLIVSNRRKAPFSTGKRILSCKLCTTGTMKGNLSRIPNITKSNGIMGTMRSYVKQTMLLLRKNSQ